MIMFTTDAKYDYQLETEKEREMSKKLITTYDW